MNDIEIIKQKANFLDNLSKNEDALFEYINTDKSNLDEVIQQYKPEREFKPVNTLRFLVANELKKGTVINAIVIKELKQAIEARDVSSYYNLNETVKQSLINYKESKIGMFPNWKHTFKVLFPFLYNLSENETIKEQLNQKADAIIESSQLENVTKHVVGFQGTQNYGTDHVWVAIIPKSAPSVQYAFQIFFTINKNGFFGGLHKGHNLKKQAFTDQHIEFNVWEDYIEHTKQAKDQWLHLNSDVNFIFLNDEKALVKVIKKVDTSALFDYFKTLDRLKEDLEIQDEEKFVFSIAKNQLSFQVGKRYCLNVNKKLFDFISYNEFEGDSHDRETFSGSDNAYLYNNRPAEDVFNHYEDIRIAIETEIERENHALAKSYDNSAFRKAVFDKEYRSKFIKGDFSCDRIILNGQRIFKISMGKDYFNDQEIEKAINEKVVLVHSQTKPKGRSKISQADIFSNVMKEGDFFYLTHSNKSIKLIGVITSPSKPADFNNMRNDGWIERSFEPMILSTIDGGFYGEAKYWTPNTNVTCWQVEQSEIEEANRILFKPHFNIEFIKNEMESKFENFLNLSVSAGTVKTYLSAIRSIEKLAKNEGVLLGAFYEFNNLKPFQAFKDNLKNLEIYINTNNKQHNRYSSALLKYEEFLNYLEQKPELPQKKYTSPLNQIFYGPPGTGKTYNTILEAAKIIEQDASISYDKAQKVFNRHLGDRIEFVTFHQNYSYEDFIQGLRPDIDQKVLSFNRADGVFAKMATNALFEYYKVYQQQQNELRNNADVKVDLNDAYIEFLNSLSVGQEFETKTGMKIKVDNFTDRQNIDFKPLNGIQTYLVSGNRLLKLYEVFSDINDIKRVHEDIRDAIGGCNSSIYYVALREFISFLKVYEETLKEFGDVEEEYEYDNITYRRKKELLTNTNLEEFRTVSTNEVPKYVIIIDEINRANISRVFGELITLIEEDKRSGGKIPLAATLPSGEKFIVPSNLYIIGTMNTADKSIALLDIALRRRFEFKAMYPKYEILNKKIHKAKFLEKLNKLIVDSGKGYDFTIGHSYFMCDENEAFDYENTINNKVIPLMLEYYMNDEDEVKKIMIEALKDDGFKVGNWPIEILPND